MRKLLAAAGILVLPLLGCGRRTAGNGDGMAAPPPKPETIHWRGEETGYQVTTVGNGKSDPAVEPGTSTAKH